MIRSAQFSDDGMYRYSLFCGWGDGEKMIFVLLHPSSPDPDIDEEEQDPELADPTIGRIIDIAQREGAGSVLVLSLHAFRTSDSSELWNGEQYPDGPENDNLLRHYLRNEPGRVVVAWGGTAKAARVERFREIAGTTPLFSLGTNKDGSPRHPLRTSEDTVLDPWQG